MVGLRNLQARSHMGASSNFSLTLGMGTAWWCGVGILHWRLAPGLQCSHPANKGALPTPQKNSARCLKHKGLSGAVHASTAAAAWCQPAAAGSAAGDAASGEVPPANAAQCEWSENQSQRVARPACSRPGGSPLSVLPGGTTSRPPARRRWHRASPAEWNVAGRGGGCAGQPPLGHARR